MIEAGGGREGYETFLAESADVVVTDLNMADGDGIEFINKLHQERASMPIVAVSGGGMFPKSLLLANAKLMGATVQLGKPFEASQLLAAIDQALAGQ